MVNFSQTTVTQTCIWIGCNSLMLVSRHQFLQAVIMSVTKYHFVTCLTYVRNAYYILNSQLSLFP